MDMRMPVSKLFWSQKSILRFGASVMLAAALVLAGCGGDEDTPDDVTPGDAANDSNEDAAPSDTTGDTPGDTTGDTTTDVTPGDTPDDVTPDECNPGYVLTSDGCVDIDECALNTHNCPEDALCKNTDGSFECECQPGFVWDGQDCKDEAKWVAVVHIGGGLGMLDTDNMVLHGPFLMGQLGQGLLTDIVVTPDGKTALIAASHPSPAFIRFVDISDVMNPALSNNLLLPMKPTDIAISADGKYALVAGYDSRIVVVDIEAKKIVDTFLSREGNHFTIEIAPDGTVVTTDDRAGQVSAFLLADNGKLSKITTHDLSAQMGVPLNVAIAPDGVTVMISGFTPYVENTPYSQLLAVFEITEPGELALKSVLYDIPRPVQSIAFDKAGKHAYMLGGKAGGLPVKKIQPNEAGYLYPNFAPDSPIPEDEMDLLMVANIKQPGVVTFDPSHFARLKRQSTMPMRTRLQAMGRLLRGH